MTVWKPEQGRPTVECTDCETAPVAFGKYVGSDSSATTKRIIECPNCGQQGEVTYELHGPNAWLEDSGFAIRELPDSDG